jgi:hypothetical protein
VSPYRPIQSGIYGRVVGNATHVHFGQKYGTAGSSNMIFDAVFTFCGEIETFAVARAYHLEAKVHTHTSSLQNLNSVLYSTI